MGSSLTLFADIGPEPEKKSSKAKKAKSKAEVGAGVRTRSSVGASQGLPRLTPAPTSALVAQPPVEAPKPVSLPCPVPGCVAKRNGSLALCAEHIALVSPSVQSEEIASRGDEKRHAKAMRVMIGCVRQRLGKDAPVDPATYADPPEVRERIRRTLIEHGLIADDKSGKLDFQTAWDKRRAAGFGPLPATDGTKIIPIDSLKESHPAIYERNKKLGLFSDNHIKTPDCLAREIDAEFRAYLAAALLRAGNADAASRILRGEVAPVVSTEVVHDEVVDVGGGACGLGGSLGRAHSPPPTAGSSSCAEDASIVYTEDMEPQSPKDFRRAASIHLRLVRARHVLRRSLRGAEEQRAVFAKRLLDAEPDDLGNLIDPETGEVLAGPSSQDGIRERREREAELKRRRRAERLRDSAAPERVLRAPREAWPGVDAAYCAAESARIERLLEKMDERVV